MPDFHFKEMEPGGMGATEEDKVSSFRSDLVTAQVLLIAITSGTACAVALFFKAYAKYPYICLAQVLTGAVAAGLDFALRASSGELRALGYLGFTRRIAFYRRFPFYATCFGTAVMLLAYGIFEVLSTNFSDGTRFYFGLGVLAVELVLTAWSSALLLPMTWEFNKNNPLPDARAYAGQYTYSDVALSSFAGEYSALQGASADERVGKGEGGAVVRHQADMIGFLQTKVGDLGEQLLLVVGQLQASEAEVNALKRAMAARGIDPSATSTTTGFSSQTSNFATEGTWEVTDRHGTNEKEQLRRSKQQQQQLVEENTRLLALLRQEKRKIKKLERVVAIEKEAAKDFAAAIENSLE